MSARLEVGVRLYKTISESGCWRSTVSVPQRGPWAAWSQGALRGLSQTPVSSRAGWGCRAGWLIGGWSVGSHCQAQSRLLTASYQQTLSVFSAAPGDTGCAHGAGPCVCARACACAVAGVCQGFWVVLERDSITLRVPVCGVHGTSPRSSIRGHARPLLGAGDM